MSKKIRRVIVAVYAVVALLLSPLTARAADPIKVGFSMALTGAVAQNGKQLIIALELWRDDVNAHGGLLGRPVELVYYDDQSNPANVPGIYTKLITVDKVDLLLGPYATNMAAPAVPVIMEHNMMTVSILAIGVNRYFHYPRYFDMIPVGPDGVRSFSRGFFELAAAAQPKPQTVAIIAADAEFSPENSSAGRCARERQCAGIRLQDRLRPELPADHDRLCAGGARGAGAANPDIVFVAAYPPDTVGIMRAAAESWPQAENVRRHHDRIVDQRRSVHGIRPAGLERRRHHAKLRAGHKTFNFPGIDDVLKRNTRSAKRPPARRSTPFGYRLRAVRLRRRPGALAQAVAGDELARSRQDRRLHATATRFHTVVGDVEYDAAGRMGEAAHAVHPVPECSAEGNLAQFGDGSVEPILWPPQFKTGEMIYPYGAARK